MTRSHSRTAPLSPFDNQAMFTFQHGYFIQQLALRAENDKG